jgi:hypothetical protein
MFQRACSGFALLFCFGALAAGQPCLVDPLDAKELARAKRARSSVEVTNLLRSRWNAARGEFKGRLKEFLAGRGTLAFFQEALQRFRDAGLARCKNQIARLECLDEYWQLTWLAEQVNRHREEAGRISTKEYYEVQYQRMGAETNFARAWSANTKKETYPSFSDLCAVFFPLYGTDQVDESDPELREFRSSQDSILQSKELARAKFNATQVRPEQVGDKRWQPALFSFQAREKNFLAGRYTLEFLNDAAARLREAGFAICRNDRDRFAQQEIYWLTAIQNEFTNDSWYANGRIPLYDALINRAVRLEADQDLKESYALTRVSPTLLPPIGLDFFIEAVAWEGFPRVLGVKEVARRMYAALHTDRQQNLMTRKRCWQAVHEEREKEFMAGRGTLDFLLLACARLLQADLALSKDRKERSRAREQYWERIERIEEINWDRYQAGRIPIQDYLQPGSSCSMRQPS